VKDERKELTPAYGHLALLIRPFPDFDPAFIKPARQKAVELLNLKEGDRVLDVGCGPGGSFPYLVHAIGQSGQVVGIEISPAISINARRRIEKNRWKNVQVIEAAARDVRLTGTFNGLLMFAAADVYASEEALANIFPHLGENARVVAFGAKLSRNRLGALLNPVLRMLFSLSFSTTPRPDCEPWRILEKRVKHADIEEYFLGLMFLASGSVATMKSSNQSLLSTG
jgi:demethylmenaquinone methyltransferase/2-methoxy-6-polyprenyl-1,4-benzoquinol methylase